VEHPFYAYSRPTAQGGAKRGHWPLLVEDMRDISCAMKQHAHKTAGHFRDCFVASLLLRLSVKKRSGKGQIPLRCPAR